MAVQPRVLLLHLLDLILESELQLSIFGYIIVENLTFDVEKTSFGFTEQSSVQIEVLELALLLILVNLMNYPANALVEARMVGVSFDNHIFIQLLTLFYR